MLGGEVRDYSRGAFGDQPPHSSSCSNRCWGRLSAVASSIGVCLLVVGYTLLGAVTFMALEGRAPPPPPPPPPPHDRLRAQTVEKLWAITEDLNILYRDNWTRLAEHEVLKFQNTLIRKYNLNALPHKNYNWNFPSAFLYSLTLITTIGYGNVTPRTAWGRLMTIAYALVGIPLMLVYLSTVGDTLAAYFRQAYARLRRRRRRPPAKGESFPPEKRPPPERPRVPVPLTLLVALAYVAAGAVLFNRLENWSLIEGSYFCFTSLGTIGFGELVPGARREASVFASCAFILVGMAVVAMCFNLVQDEAVVLARRAGGLWGRGGSSPGAAAAAAAAAAAS